MNDTVNVLLTEWCNVGGTVAGLLEALQTDQDRELAQAYGVTDADLIELQQLSKGVDQFLARVAHTGGDQSIEPHDVWLKRVVREMVELAQHGPGQTERRTRTRPGHAEELARKAWLATGGTLASFNGLTGEQRAELVGLFSDESEGGI